MVMVPNGGLTTSHEKEPVDKILTYDEETGEKNAVEGYKIEVPSYNVVLETHERRFDPGRSDLNPDNPLVLLNMYADSPVYVGGEDDSIHDFYNDTRREVEYWLGEADEWTPSIGLHDAPADIGVYERYGGELHVKIEAATTDTWLEHGIATLLHPLLPSARGRS